MSLVKYYHPRYNVNRSLVNEMFNNLVHSEYHENYLQNCKKPPINIFESDKDFRIELMLPGFTKEDLKINFHNEILTVGVDNKEKETSKEEAVKNLQREFGVYNFAKEFKIPTSVNTSEIDAHFENGILNVILPKKEESLEKSPVEIKVS